MCVFILFWLLLLFHFFVSNVCFCFCFLLSRQVARRGIHVPGGGRMVVTCFWSNDEVVFQTYDPRDSRRMRTSVTMVYLKVWLTDEQVSKRAGASTLPQGSCGGWGVWASA